MKTRAAHATNVTHTQQKSRAPMKTRGAHATKEVMRRARHTPRASKRAATNNHVLVRAVIAQLPFRGGAVGEVLSPWTQISTTHPATSKQGISN